MSATLRARRSRLALSPAYVTLASSSAAATENRDCSVVAVSVLAEVSYDAARAALGQAGRQNGQGCSMGQIRTAITALGGSMHWLPDSRIAALIRTYPERDRVLRGLTTLHPTRFARQWAALPPLLLETCNHVAAFRDAQIHDWSIYHALRVRRLWIVASPAMLRDGDGTAVIDSLFRRLPI